VKEEGLHLRRKKNKGQDRTGSKDERKAGTERRRCGASGQPANNQ
jgi:hypothetical protein